jgi:glycosyltransferase domain-containing protein
VTDDRVTVLLTLKGREDFNPRWIDYHARIGLSWPVIVGDGAPNDANRALFSSPNGLKVSYLEFDDAGFPDFYRKLRDITAAATTPYVMLVDNDDFIVPAGVGLSADFLDAHADYVSAGGLVLGMYVTGPSLSMSDKIVSGGCVSGLRSIYPVVAYDGSGGLERVTSCLNRYAPTWYSLHRRKDSLAVFSALVESGISDVGVMELFVATMLAARGKQMQTASQVNYVRQLNSSSVGVNMADLMSRVFSGKLVSDTRRLSEMLADVMAPGSSNAAARAEIVQKLLDALADYYRRQLLPISEVARRRRFVKRYVHTARAKLPFVHSAGSMIELASIRRVLRQGAASDSTIASCLAAINSMRSAIQPNARTA